MDIIVFRRRLVLCRRRLVLLSSQLRVFTTGSLHHGNTTLSSCKWLSNIQDFYLDIFNTYLQSSNDYSTTRSYNSRLYVQLFPN
uniref:HGWP repeat containing protein-like n=1 Tax=Oryza sativa subsp. japonica TaxID=39947 RepID=Q7EYS5_ORYSJ|nr:HGWP repeat containing protein-like [Oryza sativa Japonica Group]BAC99794.1 HGWP repeat containing protein-like [Oryza sativa Japonica Group]BAD68535.1 HGWP repeat containing protein-like [Oryza sativa Japonica Group]